MLRPDAWPLTPYLAANGNIFLTEATDLALLILIEDQPGVLHDLTGVISTHRANVAYVDITERREARATIYFELEDVIDAEGLIRDVGTISAVAQTSRVEPFARVYGKRIIVIGGGAQVGQ